MKNRLANDKEKDESRFLVVRRLERCDGGVLNESSLRVSRGRDELV